MIIFIARKKSYFPSYVFICFALCEQYTVRLQVVFHNFIQNIIIHRNIILISDVYLSYEYFVWALEHTYDKMFVIFL